MRMGGGERMKGRGNIRKIRMRMRKEDKTKISGGI